jgi:hypothetical protein
MIRHGKQIFRDTFVAEEILHTFFEKMNICSKYVSRGFPKYKFVLKICHEICVIKVLLNRIKIRKGA